MRITIRWPAEPGSRYSTAEAEAMVGARCYVPDGDERREIGFIVSATRFNRGSVITLELELHSERDRLIAEMRAFSVGQSLIP